MKKEVIILSIIAIFVLAPGCTDFNFGNFGDDKTSTNGELDLQSVIQLTDFTNGLDHKYSSISGNGEKIIYIQYPRDEDVFQIGETDHVHNAWTLWVTDTSGSQVQEEIFDGYQNFYGFNGDNGGTPVLNYDATYAYFGVRKYINYIGYYWLPAHNPDFLARVRLSDKDFQPIDLIQHTGYDFTWLQCFRLTSDSIYCLVTFSDKYEAGTEVKGVGFIKMDLDGNNQDFIYTNFDLTSDDCPRTGYTFFIDETYNRLYYEPRLVDYYYYLDLNTYNTVKLNNDEIETYWLRAVYDNKLILSYSEDFYIYDIATTQVTKIICDQEGSDLYSITSDKIFYNIGSGLFSYMDYEGNYVNLIGMDEKNFSSYNGKFTWDGQFTPTNGKPVSEDGKKLLVKEMWQNMDNPNYYILKLSGSTNSNSDASDDTNNDNSNNNGGTNPAILVHSIQMFDFSTGQYVSEDWTTEDLDVITITNDNKARLYAHNDALIKEVGDSSYLSYIDVPAGSTCELVDSEGGTATFTVLSIGSTTEGYPTATITWSYNP